MTNSFSVEWYGVARLSLALKELPARFQKQAVQPALKETAKRVVLPDALRNVPVKTGNLQRSLKVRVGKGKGGKRLPRGVIGFAVATTKTKTRDGFYGLWVFTGAKNRDGTKRPGSRTLRNALYGNQAAIKSMSTALMRKRLPMAVIQARQFAAAKKAKKALR